MTMAGLDGIEKKLDPGDPLDKNIYDLPPDEPPGPSCPETLEGAIA